LPDALRDPSGFRAAVVECIHRNGIDVVVPVTDAASRALLPVPEQLLPAQLAGSAFAGYELLSHKARLLDLAREHGIAGPPSVLARDSGEAWGAGAELGYPVVFKPVESVGSNVDGRPQKRSVVVVTSAEQVERVWDESVGAGHALVQTVVPGWGEGMFLLRWHGETKAVFAHRRLREFPPTGGVSVLRESIAVDVDLQRRIECVLDAADFDGIAMAEFRTDGQSRWLMEFNARLWGSLQLAVDSGVDFPSHFVDAVLGEPAKETPSYRVGIRSRWLLGELDHSIALARGRGEPQGIAGLGAALGVLLRPAGRGTRWEVLRRSDPMPFLYELVSWFHTLGAGED
jgi:predicted ATP-grasp superfamily ATP-dependent carboligase